MITIKNDILTASISELGAELRSLVKNGKEYIWEGNPEVWGNAAIILFPICGGLKDDKYTLAGKEYSLKKHGFAKNKYFSVEELTEDAVTLLLTDDKETRAQYPFKFEFRVIFKLIGDKLEVLYKVKNLSEDTMYFSVGAHEGYATPEGVEEYDIIFPQEETLNATMLDGNLLSKKKIPIIKESRFLPLYDKYFLIDALVFEDLKSRSVTLRNRKSGKSVTVEFPDCDYFLLWHKHSGGYICLEPWSGIPDRHGSDYDITKKDGITALESGKEYINTHSITVTEG